jgi:hypothetical protein
LAVTQKLQKIKIKNTAPDAHGEILIWLPSKDDPPHCSHKVSKLAWYFDLAWEEE